MRERMTGRSRRAGKTNPGVPDGTGPASGGPPMSGRRRGPCVEPDEDVDLEELEYPEEEVEVVVAKRLVALAGELAGDSRHRQADDSMKLADLFTRFLIGDREVALRQLKAMAGESFEGDLTSLVQSGKYNQLFGTLKSGLAKVIKQNLPV